MELSGALVERGLTLLRVLRTDSGHRVEIRREHDADTDFSSYGIRRPIDQLPCSDPVVLGDAAARALLEEHHAAPALAALLEGMRAGGHELVSLFVNAALELEVIHYVHSSARGLRNGFHGLRAGGIRRFARGTPEADILADGLKLARAMSYKCAAAELPYGGSKTTVRANALDVDDDARLGYLAWCIDRGFVITGPDVGFAPELIDRLAQRFTRHILCGPSGPLGHTGAPTAEGVFIAIRRAAEHRWGSTSLANKRAAMQGLGAVGLELSQRLHAAGMRVVAADPDPGRIAEARRVLPEIEIVAPEAILTQECELLCPCALGGVLDESTIAALRCELVYGAANNPLRARSTAEELVLAERLAARGIGFQPDWTITFGGVLAGHEEYAHREHASLERVHEALRRLAGDKTSALLADATQRGITPTALAYERVERLLVPV